MNARESALLRARSQRQAALERLQDLLRIPSISTFSDHKPRMLEAAGWLQQRLEEIGLEAVEIMPTEGHPVVFGQWLHAGSEAPTVLYYGHYDVQPADPLELWTNEPFEPVIRGDDILARGASDMKGQVCAFLEAVEAMTQTSGLPVNLKVMLEGEEELGSPHLAAFMARHKDLLACDVCVNGDSAILAPNLPSIVYGLRGLAYFEIRVQAAAQDLHSGGFGGVVDNPALVLARLLADMRDESGRITLPGFYDDVRPLSVEERAELAAVPLDDAWWLKTTGAPALFGEAGYSTIERAVARPTLDVCGFASGFVGEGMKTVLPARAMAKVSMRLVADQTTERVEESLRAYLQERAPDTVTWELERLGSARPVIVERDSAPVAAAMRALQYVWGRKPVLTRLGYTVPVVSMVQEMLGVDSLMLGFGLTDDRQHAPDEKFHLPNFYRGIETYIHFVYELVADASDEA